jgi:RNA polymerase sigma factor (sigma-70 family)
MPDSAPLNPVRRKVASRANLLGRMELVERLAHPARKEQRVNSGDDQARFARVVLPHLADAYALARWLTGDGADAEDVVQDACLRAFRGISRFGEGSGRAWVLTIVRHTAYTWLGKNRPTTLLVTDDLEAVERVELARRGTDAEAATPEAELIAKADAASLEAAIQKLPPPFRETLVLRDVQGLDYKEIAKVTGVPIGTVMSRLARARQRVMATITKD